MKTRKQVERDIDAIIDRFAEEGRQLKMDTPFGEDTGFYITCRALKDMLIVGLVYGKKSAFKMRSNA